MLADWRKHPVTRVMMEALDKRRLQIAELLLTTQGVTAENLLIQHSMTIAQINLIQEIVSCDLFLEELDNDEA